MVTLFAISASIKTQFQKRSNFLNQFRIIKNHDSLSFIRLETHPKKSTKIELQRW
jgi:hypothetical protein